MKLLKKTTTNTMDYEKLYSLKENFTGQSFQWIKTTDSNLMGKVVKCIDVDMRGDKYYVMFDDKSSIESTYLNRNLMMIHGDMKPLSKEEVLSLNPPTPQFPTQPVQPTQLIQHTPVQQITVTPGQNVSQLVKQNIFTLFNTEETALVLKLLVKLPDKKLLKLMYSSSENKKEFMDQLSEYLLSKINKSVIIDSISQMLDTVPKSSENKSGKAKIYDHQDE